MEEPKPKLWNWNTRLGVVLCLCSGVADSIWIGVVLSSFLFGLARLMGKEYEENTLVGWGEAAWGISQLVFALPVGFLADKWSKAKTIAVGSVIMLIAIAVSWWGVEKGAHGEDTQSHDGECFSYSYLLS
jgi:MFS family permease